MVKYTMLNVLGSLFVKTWCKREKYLSFLSCTKFNLSKKKLIDLMKMD